MFRRATPETFVLEAPSSCLVDLYVLETTRGKLSPRLVARDISAPFTLTATLETLRP